MAVLPILRTENVEGSTFPSAPEGRGYRRGWWVRVGAWVGWRCWLFWRSLSSLEEMPARAASRWESPVGAMRALIGSWAPVRAPEAVAPAERDADRDADRDPERDAEPGVVLGVVLVPRPPAPDTPEPRPESRPAPCPGAGRRDPLPLTTHPQNHRNHQDHPGCRGRRGFSGRWGCLCCWVWLLGR